MLLALVLIFFKNVFYIKDAFFTLLSFAYSGKYLYLSKDFKLLSSAYLDNVAIASAFLIFLAIVLIFLALIFLKSIFKFKLFESKLLLASLFILALSDSLANVFLYFMREGLVEPSEFLLSFVAKGLYYAHFYPYYILGFILILAIHSLSSIPKDIIKKGYMDIKTRLNIGKKMNIKFYFNAAFLCFLLGIFNLLFYDLYASKGLSIDPPVIVEPNKDDLFIFDIKELSDNKLHRYAYVADDGRISRFFLLNKREDRSSPVAVFDACKICGDMGYVKKGSELICISCNVRIFLPSVGKEGGCNPITMKYKIEGDKLIISLKEIEFGLGIFSTTMEKEVIDPVDKSKLINLKAKFSYIYNDKTYFFSSKENQEAFKANPKLYIKTK